MAHEDLVFDRNALADESVRGYLAASADLGVLLDFHERPDLGPIPDRAAVEVDELLDFDVAAKADIGSDALEWTGHKRHRIFSGTHSHI
jgi:hypothetical protein